MVPLRTRPRLPRSSNPVNDNTKWTWPSKNPQFSKKLMELVPNFAPGMVKNFHSWLTNDQAKKIADSLKIHFL